MAKKDGKTVKDLHQTEDSELRTKEDSAYLKLKRRIMFGELPPGQFLSQRMLAEQAGTTTGTVRSVLRRLENDGLIESVPRWGVRIPSETEETVRDRYYLRDVLEEAAIRRVFERHHHEDVEHLHKLAKELDDVLSEPDPDILEYAERHATLHQALIELAGSQSLLDAYLRINMRSRMLLNATRSWERIVADGTTGHQGHIDRVFSGDEEAAVNEVREHVQLGFEYELQALKTRYGS